MTEGRLRVLWLQEQPVQYFGPLYRLLAESRELNVTLGYFRPDAAVTGYVDPGFNERVVWDVPLLDGYCWVDVAMAAKISGSLGMRSFWQWFTYLRSYDIVITQGYNHQSTLPVIAVSRVARPRWFFMTDAISDDPQSGTSRFANRSLRRLMLRLLVAAATCVMTTSSRARRFHEGLHAGAGGHVSLVPYVADSVVFDKSKIPESADAKTAMGIPTQNVVFGFVGKLVDRKRPSDLIRAIVEIPDSTALIVGAGELSDNLAALAEELGVSSRVVFTGFRNQTDLPALYAAMDVFVLPSDEEPFGLVVHEAALLGVPTVCTTACGAYDDLVAPVSSALGYDAGDVQALANVLMNLATDPVRRKHAAARAQQVSEHWNLALQLSGFVEACSRR